MVLSWSDVVRTTFLGPAVFEVVPEHRPLVRGWLLAQQLAHAAQRDVHSPTVEGWALLDGGVTAISGYGLTSLPHGLRVVGFGALRLLLAELGVDGPADRFPDEPATDLDELRERLRATPPGSPHVREQAELLATCRDAVLLRWVAVTLFREAGSRLPGPGGRPAPSVGIPAPAEPVDGSRITRPEPEPGGTLRWPAPGRGGLPETGPMPLVSAERTPPGGSRF
jgi:hypothetical protein